MLNKKHDPDMPRVPLWKKMNLTVEEAAEYSGIGVSKIKEISNQKNCPFVLWNGTKRLIKKKTIRGLSRNTIFRLRGGQANG